MVFGHFRTFLDYSIDFDTFLLVIWFDIEIFHTRATRRIRCKGPEIQTSYQSPFFMVCESGKPIPGNSIFRPLLDGSQILTFSSQPQLLSLILAKLSHPKCLYGPWDDIRFSPKSEICHGFCLQLFTCCEKPTFRFCLYKCVFFDI